MQMKSYLAVVKAKPSWRDVRNDCNADEGVDNLLKEPTVKSATHAFQMTEELSEFANYHDNEELSNTLIKVSGIL